MKKFEFENLLKFLNCSIRIFKKKKKELLNFILYFLFIYKYKITTYDSLFMFNQIG